MKGRGAWVAVLVVALAVVPAPAHAAVALALNPTTNQFFGNQPQGFGTDDAESITASSLFDPSGQHVLAFSGARGAFTATQPCTVTSASTAQCPFRQDASVGRALIDLAGGDDRFTEGAVDAGTQQAFVDVVLGPGNDRSIPGPLNANVFAESGDDVMDLGAEVLGAGNAGPGQDLVTGGVAGPVRFGTGSDLFERTGDIATSAVTEFFEPQVVTLDGLCNDGGPADTSAADGVVRTLGPLRCEGNGVDRDNLGAEALTLNGGNLGDSLTGSPDDDRLAGGRGNDQLAAADGVDSYVGGDDDDTILARDGIADRLIRCGDGADRAVVDPVDPVEPDCEVIERGGAGTSGPVGGGEPLPPGTPGVPPEATEPTAPQQQNVPSSETGGAGPGGGDGGATPPEVRMADQVATVRRGRAELRVVCVYRAQQCTGSLELFAAKQVKKGNTKLKKGAAIGDADIAIPWGVDEAVQVPLSRKAKSLLKGDKKLAANATVEATDGAAADGAVGRATAKVKLGGR